MVVVVLIIMAMMIMEMVVVSDGDDGELTADSLGWSLFLHLSEVCQFRERHWNTFESASSYH